MVNESRQAGDSDALFRARECYLRLHIGNRALESIASNPASDLLASYERGVADAMGDSLFIQDKLQQFDAACTDIGKDGLDFGNLNRV
jgi:hypothetical protein